MSYIPGQLPMDLPKFKIRFVLAIAAAEGMLMLPLDVSNIFHTNIEFNPAERVHISIPPFYLEYFFTKWPDHPLKDTPAGKLCIQALWSMQEGSKDAGRKWYLLLKAICFNELDMVVSTYDTAFLSWS
eukprot:7641899-Ditylum_brightwellii.AAC.1